MSQSSRSTRSHFVIGIGFALVGILAGGWSLVRYHSRGAILVVDSPVRTLPKSDGTQSTPKVAFELKNSGSQVLVIDRISSSCGCAVVNAPKRKLDPGETTTLEVTAVRPPVGVKTVDVVIRSNSRAGATTTLKVTGFGEMQFPYVQFGTDVVAFRGIRESGATEGFWLVTIEREHDDPWIQGLTTDLPFVRLSVLDNSKTERFETGFIERTYRFQAEIVVLPVPGVYKGAVTLPDGTDFKLPLVCEIPNRFSVSPPALYASLAPSDESRSAIVTLRSPNVAELSQSLEISASEPEVVQLSNAEFIGEDEAVYRVTLRPGVTAYTRCEIQFRIPGESATPPLRIPVVIVRTESE